MNAHRQSLWNKTSQQGMFFSWALRYRHNSHHVNAMKSELEVVQAEGSGPWN